MQYIENKTFDELMVGDRAEITRTLRRQDIELFVSGSVDINPRQVDEDDAMSDIFHGVIAQEIWGGALIAGILGTELPGPGTIYLNQLLRFHRPIGVGDSVTVRVSVKEKEQEKKHLIIECACFNQDGETVISGEAKVVAPTEKVRRPRVVLPQVHLHARGARYGQLIEATRQLEPIRTAVVHPCDATSLGGALAARDEGLIQPVLIGPRFKIEAAAGAMDARLDSIEIVDVRHSHAASDKAVELVRTGHAEAIMKGALHTDELMGAVLRSDTGLRTERRLSHIFALDVPHYPKPLLITDAAINIAPDLSAKRDIVQNAIDIAHALGIDLPKVAILSAVETVRPKIASTVEAAALCKMADRGQITGGVLDGPLAFDNAISTEAAQIKNIESPVAGRADILVVPDLESGNMLAKQLIYLAGAEAAGLVLGARVPIMLTSRADGKLARLASAAVAQLYVHRRKGIVT